MTEPDPKTQILTAAKQVIAAKGFAKATMNDFVRASGLSKGGVYWHFQSKDEILAALFDEFFTVQLALLDTVLAQSGNVTDKLRQLAALSSTAVSDLAQPFPSPLEFYALAAREPVLRPILRTHFAAYRQRIGNLVQQGVQAGEFAPISAGETAVSIIALFEGVLLLWAVDPTPSDLSTQVNHALELLLAGMR